LNDGFSTVELLVSITILVLVSASVYINYSDFRDSFSLKRTAQEVALAIREAQVYGLAVMETSSGSNTFPGYGIYFDKNTPQDFVLFADKNNNGIYDKGGGCGAVDTECVESYKITTTNKIGSLCAGEDCTISNLNIVFLRPNPFVILKSDKGAGYDNVSISVISPAGKVKMIKVISSGQISVE